MKYSTFDKLLKLYVLLNIICVIVTIAGLFMRDAYVIILGCQGTILLFCIPVIYLAVRIVKDFIQSDIKR